MSRTLDDVPGRRWRSRFARLHLKAYLGMHAVAGALATIALVWLFGYIADEIPEHSTLVRVDDAIGRWFERHGTEAGERILHAFSYLGAPLLAAMVVAAIVLFAWRGERRAAITIAITGGGGMLLGNVLKFVFHRGRPQTATEFITRQTWSFPSGHAMNSMICYGIIAALLLERTADRARRIAIVAVAVVLVAVIGFSRLYIGVHYLSDVIGGWVAGAAWLLVCLSAYRIVRDVARGKTGAAVSTKP